MTTLTVASITHAARHAAGHVDPILNLPIFDTRNYGAKIDNATNDTAAVAAAYAAAVANGGGLIYSAGGRSIVTSLPHLTPVSDGSVPYAFIGDGSGISVLVHNGTSQSSSLTVSNPNFSPSNPSQNAPTWRGITFDGSGSSGGTAGIIWGDVSYGSFDDIVVKGFTTGDGMFFNNAYGWTEGMRLSNIRALNNQSAIRFAVGVGATLGTVSTTIANGATGVTTIAVSPLTAAISSGQVFLIWPGSGTVSQNVTATAPASVGATSISVAAFTAAAAYTSGIAEVTTGSYGSFDYWNVDGLYINANANQDGIVSEISLGLGQNTTRFGSRWRVTGNFQKGSSNTGAFMRLKGNDQWDPVLWDVAVEADGGAAVAHKALVDGNGASSLGGAGTFIAYGLATATFTGGTYDFNITGNVCVAGITDKGQSSSGLNIKPMVDLPKASNIEGGASPTSGTGTGTYPGTTLANATPYQNTTGYDVFVALTFTFTGTGTCSATSDNWNGLPAANPMFNAVSGDVRTIFLKHTAGNWARVDYSNATVSVNTARWY